MSAFGSHRLLHRGALGAVASYYAARLILLGTVATMSALAWRIFPPAITLEMTIHTGAAAVAPVKSTEGSADSDESPDSDEGFVLEPDADLVNSI